MTTPGTNTFAVFATNINGTYVPSVSAGWSINGAIGASAITLSSVTESSSGFYLVNVNIPQAGFGFLKINNSDSSLYINPDFYSLEVTNYDDDDTYAKMTAIGVANLPSGSPNRFTTVNINAKQDSTITETVQLASQFLPLTGWTGWNVNVYPATKLTSSTIPALSGSTSCSVINASAGLVSVTIQNNVLQGLIAEGSATTTLYADIDALDASGYERRPVELNITLRRNF